MSPPFLNMNDAKKNIALNILALDTAAQACSAALYARGAVTQRLEIAPRAHSGLAPDMAEELLRAAGLQWAQLDALAVDIGPGAFTGLRIGIGLAQGLAYGAGIKIIPVISLEALAFAEVGGGDSNSDNNGDGDGNSDSGNVEILAALDARMGQVYYAHYRATAGGDLSCITSPTLATPEQVRIKNSGRKITGVGSGWESYAPQLCAATNVTNWRGGCYPQAASVAQLAARRGLRAAVPPLDLRACYVRDEVATPG